MSGSLTQFGIGKETTYGTAVVVTKFYEIVSENFMGNYERNQADALSAAYFDRSDRFGLVLKGAKGTVELEPLTKGFGHWLYFMQGSLVTTGPTETSVYTHTADVGTLFGKNITCQVGRADETGTVQPWTYEGGKVTDYEFSSSVDKTLHVQIGMDFEKESQTTGGAYSLATNVPVTGADVLGWQGGTIKVGGSTVDVDDLSVKVDNSQNTDRWYINRASSKREPIQDGKRTIDWSFKTTYVNTTFWAKVSSATNSGTYAALQAKWEGLTLLGTTIYPNLTIDVPVARFDKGGPTVDGPGMLEPKFSGKGLYDGTLSAIKLTYQSADVTVLPN